MGFSFAKEEKRDWRGNVSSARRFFRKATSVSKFSLQGSWFHSLRRARSCLLGQAYRRGTGTSSSCLREYGAAKSEIPDVATGPRRRCDPGHQLIRRRQQKQRRGNTVALIDIS